MVQTTERSSLKITSDIIEALENLSYDKKAISEFLKNPTTAARYFISLMTKITRIVSRALSL